jgi:hypothetical protein
MVGAALTSRPTIGARVWFAFMVASWAAFAVIAATSEHLLADAWQGARDLPLALELVVWLLTLPWMLALAAWESDWSGAARVLAVLCIAAGWTLMSIPRPKP